MGAGMGYAVIVAAGALLAYLLWQVPKLFRGLDRGQQKGRWVRDRSLGGKAVSCFPILSHTTLLTMTVLTLPSVCTACRLASFIVH